MKLKLDLSILWQCTNSIEGFKINVNTDFLTLGCLISSKPPPNVFPELSTLRMDVKLNISWARVVTISEIAPVICLVHSPASFLCSFHLVKMGRFNQSLLDCAESTFLQSQALVQASPGPTFKIFWLHESSTIIIKCPDSRPTFTFHYEHQSLCSRQTNKLASLRVSRLDP